MKAIISILFLSVLSFSATPQNQPPLERRVNLEMKDKTIEWVLTEVGKQADISFSYNPEAVGSSQKINLNIDNQPVRYVLNELFGGNMTYRERGKFIIIQPYRHNKKNIAIVEGYLTDNDGKLIANATVYSQAQNTAVATNEFGYFRLELETSDTSEQVNIKKRGYDDVLLTPVRGKTTFVQLPLSEKENSTINQQTLMLNPLGIVNKEMLAASENLDESFKRVAQLSFLPHLGTNNLLSGSTSNLFSINILGGFVESVKVFEVGGILNIVRKNAGVFQSAGVANFVGGKFIGIQSAGLLNRVGKNFYGLQFAGVGNRTGGDHRGMQGASVFNSVAGSFSGIQSSGVINSAKNKSTGLQAAGVLNTADKLTGVQAAGVLNTAKNFQGSQMASVLNYSSKGKGLQIAAVVNIADTLSGVQMSGLLNVAGVMKGVQIGIVNIADTCSGVSLGFINIIKKGYTHIDIYATETFLANIAYRGGTNRFYTILMGGINPQLVGDEMLYTYGLGAGTSFANNKKLRYDLDLIAQNVSLGTLTDDINMLYRLGFSANYPIAKKLSLTLGISYNFYLVDSTTPQYETVFSKLPPYFISNEQAGDGRNIKTWFGLKAGIRF